MKSAGYVVQFCNGCRYAGVYEEQDKNYFMYSSWWWAWAYHGKSNSGTYIRMSGGCQGCALVGVHRAMVMGRLLYKLGLYMEGYDNIHGGRG